MQDWDMIVNTLNVGFHSLLKQELDQFQISVPSHIKDITSLHTSTDSSDWECTDRWWDAGKSCKILLCWRCCLTLWLLSQCVPIQQNTFVRYWSFLMCENASTSVSVSYVVS
jgi:hypothetical protein